MYGPSHHLECRGEDMVHSAHALILQSMEVTVKLHIVKGVRGDKFSAQKEFELPSKKSNHIQGLPLF